MPYLIRSSGDSSGEQHQLQAGVNSVGRALGNTIVVIDDSMSRRHAEIEISFDQVVVRDLKSLNHTFVNNQLIIEQRLRNGDVLRCGTVEFRFVDLRPPPPNPTIPPTEVEENSSSFIKTIDPKVTSIKFKDLLTEQEHKGNVSVLRLRQANEDQRALDKLNILLEVAKELSSPDEPENLLQKILDLLFEIMSVDRAAILLKNNQSNELDCEAIKLRDDVQKSTRFYSQKITDYVFTKGEGIVTSDARVDQRFDSSESILFQSIHASMCVPLKPREEVIGVLYVDNLTLVNLYSDEDMNFLAALGNQAAIAIENNLLFKRIQAEAVMRDKLERFFPTAVTQKIKETDRLGIIETEVTALFADISGFTQMSSTMEPRQIISMLNEYFQVMVEEIVFQYEGTLEKYIGDALFAIWGAPYQRVNDPQLAVQAAIDMQWAVAKLNRKWIKEGKEPISIHIGINTGEVAAGNIGSQRLIQYAAIGDTTNVTSRICNIAKAGEIILSDATHGRLTSLNLPFEALPPTKVRGKDDPLILYKLQWRDIPAGTTKPLLQTKEYPS
ncbi:adenylate/guanylate cyclase with GAF sensor and FHA domain [[Leptolyngbya] sp. PCC 7376]|uniref:adenylate/guanylate cyclase domain-containing protein n=1 Tax=[Leptolyngbya] sp. PCC 7376 TaxID=111781 RepID=UPI00029F30BE|nr:adenylate/guanylate cyclase domain-containing protein [[Leptolyngbya] sp. PCC 7376]AFY36639.1 adenylate/guanylate cyclase with GAF sensor and FHA domain [[Leptolyngbya] sp. PCC 7376]